MSVTKKWRAELSSPPSKVTSHLDVTVPATIVKPVDNAIRILRHLSLTGQPSTVTLISRELRINPSTCFNILRTLVWNGMLEFDRNTKSYMTGLGAVELANRSLVKGGGGDVLVAMQPHMDRIADEYRLTITIWRRIGEDRMMLVHIIDNSSTIRIHVRLSQRLPLLIGAGGRVFAAFGHLEESEMSSHFAELRWSRPIDFDTYMAQVARVREKGWAIDEGTHVAGISSIAAPIFNREGTIRGVIVGTMLAGQHNKKTMQQIASQIVGLADGFSKS